jgi:hypothetical protein
MCQTGPFVVGFVDTVYNVTEGDDGLGDISVCVTLTSPEGDIGGERIFVEVFNAPRNNPLCSALATADTLDLGGFYNFDDLADYQPPLQFFNPIMKSSITQTNRIICYDQIIYGDTRAEEDECFTLTLTVQDRSSIMTSVDPQRSSAVIQIVDDEEVIICDPECQNGGTCSAPWLSDSCVCSRVSHVVHRTHVSAVQDM